VEAKERANLLRWDGSRQGFYEVYFLKFNDLASQTAGWLRYTLLSPQPKVGPPRAELWGIFFDARDPGAHFAVKKSLPIDQLRFDGNRFRLDLGEAYLAQNACRGEIVDAARGHRLAWDLGFDSASEPLFHLPHERLYTLALPKTKIVSPHVDARFCGTLTADDRTIELQAAPGQQSHMWGTQHGLRWCWGHCDAFAEDPAAVWEGLDAQVAVGPWSSPHLKVFFLRFAGAWHRFNKLSMWLSNRSTWEIGRWDFEAGSDRLRIMGTAECELADLLGVTYQDPDGRRLWCNNTKVASLSLQVQDPEGRELGRLTSRKACALEFVDRRIVPEVPVWI
jgi:hypothetical protein